MQWKSLKATEVESLVGGSLSRWSDMSRSMSHSLKCPNYGKQFLLCSACQRTTQVGRGDKGVDLFYHRFSTEWVPISHLGLEIFPGPLISCFCKCLASLCHTCMQPRSLTILLASYLKILWSLALTKHSLSFITQNETSLGNNAERTSLGRCAIQFAAQP